MKPTTLLTANGLGMTLYTPPIPGVTPAVWSVAEVVKWIESYPGSEHVAVEIDGNHVWSTYKGPTNPVVDAWLRLGGIDIDVTGYIETLRLRVSPGVVTATGVSIVTVEDGELTCHLGWEMPARGMAVSKWTIVSREGTLSEAVFQ